MPGVVRYLPTEEGKSECKAENLRSKSDIGLRNDQSFKAEQSKLDFDVSLYSITVFVQSACCPI